MLWVCTDNGGVFWFDIAADSFTDDHPLFGAAEDLPFVNIIYMTVTRDGEYWFSTQDNGILFYHTDKKNNKSGFEKLEITGDKSSNYTDAPNVLTIFEDASGLIWFGSWNTGLFTWQKRSREFVSYDHTNPDNSEQTSRVLRVLEDDDGILWICTSSGLKKYNPLTRDYAYYRHNPSDSSSIMSDVIYTAIRDSAGMVWLGTDKGLDRFNPLTESITHYFHNPDDPGSISKGLIINTFIDSKGTLWIGGWGDGLNKPVMTPEGEIEKFLHYRADDDNPASISDNSIMSFAENQDGTLWIGTAYGGLNKLVSDYQFDEKGNLVRPVFVSYRSDPNNPSGLSGNDVRSVCIDENGTFWIGTYGAGVNSFNPPRTDNDPGVFNHFTQADGLANDVVKCIYSDKLGRLWISTSYGLSMFNPPDQTFSNFYVSDGLKLDQFGGVYCKSRKTGRIYFGGNNGIVSFIPENIQINDFKPQVVITSLKTYSASAGKMVEIKGMPMKEKIIVPYRENILHIEFASLNFYNSSHLSKTF